MMLGRLRRNDLAGASRPDVFVANSNHVAARIRKHYRRDAIVVHPPVDVERSPTPSAPGGRLLPRARPRGALQEGRPGGWRLRHAGAAGEGRRRGPRPGGRPRPRRGGRRVPRLRPRLRHGRAALGSAGAAVPGRGGLRDRPGRGAGGRSARDRVRRGRRAGHRGRERNRCLSCRADRDLCRVRHPSVREHARSTSTGSGPTRAASVRRVSAPRSRTCCSSTRPTGPRHERHPGPALRARSRARLGRLRARRAAPALAGRGRGGRDLPCRGRRDRRGQLRQELREQHSRAVRHLVAVERRAAGEQLARRPRARGRHERSAGRLRGGGEQRAARPGSVDLGQRPARQGPGGSRAERQRPAGSPPATGTRARRPRSQTPSGASSSPSARAAIGRASTPPNATSSRRWTRCRPTPRSGPTCATRSTASTRCEP